MRTRVYLISCALCFIIGLAAAILAGRFFGFFVPTALGRTTSTISTNDLKSLTRNSKPWGDLESLEIPLAESDNLFPDRDLRLQPPHWFFQGLSQTELDKLFDSASLTPLQKAALLSDTNCQCNPSGCLVSPSTDLVKNLSSSARRLIYETLAKSTNNYPQCFPFRFALNGFSTRFEQTGLAPEKIGLLRELTYTNDGTLCFADIELLPSLLSPTEFNQAIEAFYRYPAYRLRIRVSPDSDINALVKYWGKGGMQRRVRPILESLARLKRDNGSSLNISVLFPPFARSRLFTFPSSWSEPQAAREDCIWTSMNFFNEQPDMTFLDSNHSRQILLRDFAIIRGEPTYGDLVCLSNDKGDLIHMCVYIADDFVFTKNGINQLQPWVLMKMQDMLLFFPSEKPHRFAILRSKDQSSAHR